MSLLTYASVPLQLQSLHHNPRPGNRDHFVHSLWRGEGSELMGLCVEGETIHKPVIDA